MTDIITIRKRHVIQMKLGVQTFTNIAASVSHQDATTYRDSGDGWTVLEVLCHMRDFDRIFYQRAVMMRDQQLPKLPAYDHEKMAIDRHYNEQEISGVMDEFVASREQFRTFFKELTPTQWERGGYHPEREGVFTMTDALMQVTLHDVVHLEQITRILAEKR